MKKILNILKEKFQPKTFESGYEKLTKELVELCFEYVKYDSKNVEEIFIFFSTEFETIWFNVFYKINNQILEKHKVGDKYAINDRKQTLLNKEANKIIQNHQGQFSIDTSNPNTKFDMILPKNAVKSAA